MKKIIKQTTLDESQRNAAEASGNVVIAAVPGSGKTTVVVERVKRLILSGQDPRRILVGTFLREVKSEIAERITDAIGQKWAKQVSVKTLHSLGLGIIQKHGDCLRGGFSRAVLRDEADLPRFYREQLYEAASDLNLMDIVRPRSGPPQLRWKHLVSYMSAMYDMLVDLESPYNDPRRIEAADKTGNPFTLNELEILAKASSLVETDKFQTGWITFDDMIHKAVSILAWDEDARRDIAAQYDHVLVDEFQDTSPGQQSLVLGFSSGGSLVIVGDDDQAIYSWRRASPQMLIRATMDETFTTVKLETNYRSGSNIVAAAQGVIERNNKRVPKVMKATKDGGEISWSEHETDASEAKTITSKVVQAIRNGESPDEIMIIARTNAQAGFITDALTDGKVPFRVPSGTTSFADLPEVKDVEAYVALAMDPKNDAAFMRIYNRPFRYLSSAWLSSLKFDSLSLLESLEMQADNPVESPPRGAVEFLDCVSRLGSMARTGSSTYSIAATAMAISKYNSWVGTDEDEQDNFRKENLDRALQFAGNYASPSEFLNALRAIRNATKQKVAKSETVLVSTIHRVKGLEADRVFIIGCRPGKLPHAKCVESLEEERRLFYVACTRARKWLHVSCDSTSISNLPAKLASVSFMKELQESSRAIAT